MTAPAGTSSRSRARDVLRLCARDLRAGAALAWLVIGVELARAVLLEWALRGGPDAFTARGFGRPDSAIDLIAVCLTAITTAIVVQADHPTDDRAFWRTRPIAPATLATAKIATLALLFVAVPTLIDGARLAAYGAPPAAIAAAAVSLTLGAVVAIVPASLLALSTGTLARFLAVAIGLFAAYGVAVVVVPPLSRLTGGLPWWDDAWRLANRLRPDRDDWPVALLGSAIACVVLVRHYVHRRWWITVMTMLVLAAALVTWPMRPEPLASPSDAARVADSRLGTPAALDLAPRSLVDERRPFVFMGLHTAPSTPLPRDLSATVRLGAVRIRAGGQLVTIDGEAECCASTGALGFVDPSHERAARQQIGWAEVPLHTSGRSALALFTPRVTVEAELRADLVRHRVVGELPARPGAAFRTGRYLLEIVDGGIVGDDRGTPTAMLAVRLAHFPGLAVGDRCGLTLFWGRSGGVDATVPWWQHPGRVEDHADFDCARRPRGHDWVQRTVLGLPVDADRLLIVESLGVGRVTVPVVGRDVPVHAPEEPTRRATPP